jgi:cation:H+ antiporter
VPGLLIGVAELLVRGASRPALAFGILPLVLELTVVAFGTSSPEVALTVRSSLRGQGDLALGNVVGSNIVALSPFAIAMAAFVIPLTVITLDPRLHDSP